MSVDFESVLTGDASGGPLLTYVKWEEETQQPEKGIFCFPSSTFSTQELMGVSRTMNLILTRKGKSVLGLSCLSSSLTEKNFRK